MMKSRVAISKGLGFICKFLRKRLMYFLCKCPLLPLPSPNSGSCPATEPTFNHEQSGLSRHDTPSKHPSGATQPTRDILATLVCRVKWLIFLTHGLPTLVRLPFQSFCCLRYLGCSETLQDLSAP